MLYLDITDLVHYFAHNRRVSGIQRVACEVASRILAAHGDEARLIAYSNYYGGYVPVDRAILSEPGHKSARRLTKTLGKHAPSLMGLARRKSKLKLFRKSPELILRKYILPALRRPLACMKLNGGDHLIVLGGVWSFQLLIDHLIALKASGVRITQVIYDLIPIHAPQFCGSGHVSKFKAWLDRTPEYASSYITISEYVRDDLLNHMKERKLTQPVVAIPLAHELRIRSERETPAIPAALAQKPYALCAGTIELRKNQFALCKAWEVLLQRHSSKVPMLALAGKWGAKSDDVKDYLTRNNYLDGNVVIVECSSDQVLRQLYSDALFCVFPSKAEGWGLPIGEAAWFGTPTVFSRTTSLIEVLPAGVADMFDPDDQQDMLRVLESYILEPKVREDARARLRNVKLRSWSDVGDDYVRYLTCSKDALAA